MMDTSTVSARKAAARLVGMNHPAAVRREVGDSPTAPFEFAAGIQDRLVLGAGGDDVPALLAVVVGDAENRQVVRLGGARRPDHFFGRGAGAGGNLRARRLHQSGGGGAIVVARRARIAEFALHPRHRAMAAATCGSTGVVAA